jgi:class I fructose-bisphosphate aldolase
MDIVSLLGNEASLLLDHKATAFPKELLTIPGPNYINDVFTLSDRSPVVLRNLGTLYGHGRLGGTGYVSILPVDQGIEHSAAASFASVTSPLRLVATPLRRRSARSARCRAVTCIGFRSS